MRIEPLFVLLAIGEVVSSAVAPDTLLFPAAIGLESCLYTLFITIGVGSSTSRFPCLEAISKARLVRETSDFGELRTPRDRDDAPEASFRVLSMIFSVASSSTICPFPCLLIGVPGFDPGPDDLLFGLKLSKKLCVISVIISISLVSGLISASVSLSVRLNRTWFVASIVAWSACISRRRVSIG